MLYKDCKLCPLESPNCTIINTNEELLGIIKSFPIPVIKGLWEKYSESRTETIIGVTVPTSVYIKDGWFYGDIILNKELDFKNYEWCNCEFETSYDCNSLNDSERKRATLINYNSIYYN